MRTQDIDALGENLNLYLARKLMSEMLGEMRRGAGRLATLGFQHLVFSADHGHVLLPEVLPGDVVAAPSGSWLKSKRRCRLGSGLTVTPGTIVLPAADVGIQGAPEEICVPVGFKVFSAGEGYFHEGLSLQECVLPAVVVRVRTTRTGQGKQEVSIRYRSEKFTSRVIGLKLRYAGLLEESVKVKVLAHGGTTANAKVVGGRCRLRRERRVDTRSDLEVRGRDRSSTVDRARLFRPVHRAQGDGSGDWPDLGSAERSRTP